MARNAERANAVLNKWLAVKNAVLKGTQQKVALGPRSQLVREIGKGISLIQDASLGEHRIRDLNDEINKKLRVKRRWEYRIKELGGPDYSTASDALSLSGIAAAGGDYYYFGAAKELPQVRELFAAQASDVNPPRKTRAQLFRRITPDYFGWRDEENEDLLLSEQQQEQLWQREREQQLREQQQKLERVAAASAADVAAGMAAAAERQQASRKHQQADKVRQRQQQQQLHQQEQEEFAGGSSLTCVASTRAIWGSVRLRVLHLFYEQDSSSSSSKRFQVYVDLPTDAEIGRLLLEKKKQLIVQKYATPQSQQQEEETRRLVAHPD
ncbi:hypothetical protein Efla_003045 [Eimeria flavescens]